MMADLIFQKRPRADSFLTCLCETELSLQSRALFADNFRRSGPATAETETLLWRPRKPLYPQKNTGLRARKSFQAWAQAFPTCYTSQLLVDDDDDDGDDDDDDDGDDDDDDDGDGDDDDDDDDDDGDDGDDVIATMVRKLAMTILSNKFPLII